MVRGAWIYVLFAICPLVLHALVFNQTLDTELHVNAIDEDGIGITVKRLPETSTSQHFSCYQIERKESSKKFCYPSINIVGVGKCGTSALYLLFARNPAVLAANVNKEYCIESQQTVFSYLSGFPSPEELIEKSFIVNGCMRQDNLYVAVHRMLAPKTALIMSVRDMADRQWAAYNYWCSTEYDINCDDPGREAKVGMYRSPELFDQLLKSTEHVLSRPFLDKCSVMSTYYTGWRYYLKESLGILPFLVASEMFLNSSLVHTALDHLEGGINRALRSELKLRVEDLKMVNTGDHRGANVIDESRHSDSGVYAISHHRPMLDSSRKHIGRCWKECAEVSQATGFQYNCISA